MILSVYVQNEGLGDLTIPSSSIKTIENVCYNAINILSNVK